MLTLLIETLRILNQSAVYLLLGFALAGLLHVVISRKERLFSPLTGPGRKPIFLAAVLGLPLPMCSCSVLPTALTLRERGASKGTTSAFLISVPEINVVSVLLTHALIGPVMAIFRPVASLVTGITAGLLIDIADRRIAPRLGKEWRSEEDRDSDSRPSGLPVSLTLGDGPSVPPSGSPERDCGCIDACADAVPGRPAPTRRAWWREALRFGFVDFYDRLIGYLVVGIVIGAILAAALPAFDIAGFAGSRWITYLIMLVIGIPMYTCATASTPVAAGLIAGGVSPGAALILLLVGPAESAASLMVLSKRFGRLVFAIHLGSIMVVSLAAGILLDALVARIGFMSIDPLPPEERTWSLPGLAAMAVIVTLTFFSFRRTRVAERAAAWAETRLNLRMRARTLVTAAGSVAVALYLLSGLFVVQPGERAAVTAFGRVTSSYLGPGLRAHWPYPFGGHDKVKVSEIRRVEIGFRSDASQTPDAEAAGRAQPFFGASAFETSRSRPEITAESWMLSGDENIIDLACVIHYRVRDSEEEVMRHLYGVEDPDALIRAAGEWSVREVIAGVAIDSLLTVAREEVEHAVKERHLQPVLDACGSGLEVISVRLNSVHAPYPVHWSFRDVASAAEDAQQSINRAREYRELLVRQAGAESTRSVQLARGSAATHRGLAAGEAKAFAAQSEVYKSDPALMRTRLHLERLDSILPGRRKYVDLTGEAGEGVSIWLRRGPGYGSAPFLPPAGQRSGDGTR